MNKDLTSDTNLMGTHHCKRLTFMMVVEAKLACAGQITLVVSLC